MAEQPPCQVRRQARINGLLVNFYKRLGFGAGSDGPVHMLCAEADKARHRVGSGPSVDDSRAARTATVSAGYVDQRTQFCAAHAAPAAGR